MAALKISSKSIARYFGSLGNPDVQSKREPISRLTEPTEPQKGDKKGIDHLFGAWEDTRTAQEIIRDIKSAGTKNRETDGFE